MGKTIYEKEVNGVHCSIELLYGVDYTDYDEDVLGYTIGEHQGLLDGKDLAIYIASLESGYFIKLSKASYNKLAFVNDLVREGIIGKETYCAIYEGKEDQFDFISRT